MGGSPYVFDGEGMWEGGSPYVFDGGRMWEATGGGSPYIFDGGRMKFVGVATPLRRRFGHIFF